MSNAMNEAAMGEAAADLQEAHNHVADVALEWAGMQPGPYRDAILADAVKEWKAAGERFHVACRASDDRLREMRAARTGGA